MLHVGFDPGRIAATVVGVETSPAMLSSSNCQPHWPTFTPSRTRFLP